MTRFLFITPFLCICCIALFVGCGDGTVAGSEAGNARVAVTVYSSDSIPAANASASLYSANGDTLVDRAFTNDSGVVEFAHLDAGAYQLYCIVNDEVLLQSVEAVNEPTPSKEYLAPVSYLRVTDSVPFGNDHYLLSLVGTPVRSVAAVRAADGSLTFGGLPAGRFPVRLTGPDVSLQTADSVAFVRSDTTDLAYSLLHISGVSFDGGFRTIAASDGQLFVGGTFGGLLLSRDSAEYLKLQKDGGAIVGGEITAAEILSSGIFVGTDSGFAYCQSGLPVYAQNCRTVFDVSAVNDTLIYVCSERDGLGVVRNGVYDDRLVDTVSTIPLLPPCVYPILDTALYVGSRSRGLHHWNATEGFTRDTSYVGWASLGINAVAIENDGSIWLVTPSSLRRKLPDASWEIYHSSIGFSSACKTSDGRLWFGGNDGNLYVWNGTAVVPVCSVSSAILGLAVGPGGGVFGVTNEKGFVFNPK